MWIRKRMLLSCLVSFLSYHLIPQRKTIWTTMGSNPARQLHKRATNQGTIFNFVLMENESPPAF